MRANVPIIHIQRPEGELLHVHFVEITDVLRYSWGVGDSYYLLTSDKFFFFPENEENTV